MCTLSTRHANKERNMRVSLSSTGPSTDALAKIFQLGVAGFTVEKLFTAVVAAVVCLVHDVLIMMAAYTILQIPMDSNMIAAVLTILGYSINATIIVFDRIRENNRLYSKKAFAENANDGINETFTRSLNTTLTTLFTIGMIFILGPSSIKAFSLPIIVGILAGLYSSVCLSSNIWILLKGKKAFEKK